MDLRIVFLSPHCDPHATLGEPDAGGQCVYEDQLAKTLSNFSNTKVTVICRQTNNRPLLEQVNKNYSIVRIHCNNGDFIPKEKIEEILTEFSKKAYKEVQRYSERLIFHGHYWDGAKALLYLKRFYPEAPIFWTPHSLGKVKRFNFPGDENERYFNFIPRLVWENYAVLFSEKIIVSSQEEKELLVDEYAAVDKKISIVKPGVCLDTFKKIDKIVARKELKLPLNGKILLCLGRITKSKGYHHAIKILKTLRKKHSDAYLVICGGSEKVQAEEERDYMNELRSLTKKVGVSKYVIFQPALPHDMVYKMYSASDIFLMTSENEPFGLTVLEAMANHVPVVASNKGGPTNIISQNRTGCLVNVHNYERFAEYISALLIDKRAYLKITKNAYNYVKKEYNWQDKAKEILEFYEKSLQKPRDPVVEWFKENYFLRNNLNL